MRRVLTKRRRERRQTQLLVVALATCALAIVVDEPTMSTVAVAVIIGVSLGVNIALLLSRSHLDFMRKSNAKRYRYFRQASRMNRKLLDDIQSVNKTNALLVDHVRRYRALVTGQKSPDVVKEWKH